MLSSIEDVAKQLRDKADQAQDILDRPGASMPQDRTVIQDLIMCARSASADLMALAGSVSSHPGLDGEPQEEFTHE